MKKLVYGLAAGALAAAMCVSFAACGGMNAKNIKGEQVTAEQWTAAFEAFEKDDAQFTITSKHSSVVDCSLDEASSPDGKKYSGKTTREQTEEVIFNAGKEYDKTTSSTKMDDGYKELAKLMGGVSEDQLKDTSETTEEYYEKTETGYTRYRKDEEGNWTKSTASYPAMLSSFTSLKAQYENYEYNENLKGYVAKGYKPAEEGENEQYTVIKFDKDGKLVAIYSYVKMDVEQSGVMMTQTQETGLTVSYSAKAVDLPTVEE